MAQLVVTGSNFLETVDHLATVIKLAVDTETTGLRPFQGDYLFSVIVADRDNEFYFNFNEKDETFAPEERLPRQLVKDLQPIFNARSPEFPPFVRRIYMHNAKFDWHMLANEGIEIGADVWCTEAAARIEYNQHLKIGLDACLTRIGLKKDDAVKKYLIANGLYEWVTPPGKKKRERRPFFDRAPRGIIVPYGCQDGRGTYALGEWQENRFNEIDAPGVVPASIWNVANNERQLTRTCFKLERHGIRIDLGYCKDALRYERARADQAEAEFLSLTGVEEFADSAKGLGPILTPLGVTPGVTDSGAPSYDWDSLQPYKDLPAVKALIECREASKRAETYYANYLNYVTPQGRIHVNLRQARPITGRFSASEPNLQNLPDPELDTGEYPVRRAFVPTIGNILVSVDFSQMEYRLMLDYAQETKVIEQVLAGVDLHEACAKMMGVTRSQAKTINFCLLYGGGDAKLAAMLGCKIAVARELRLEYFARLPKIGLFVRTVSKTAERRGYIFNWMGRRYMVPDPRFAYKAPNALIQGGCADIIKLAMNRVDAYIEHQGLKLKLILNIHDELLLDVPPEELHHIQAIVDIMKGSYKYQTLPMECSVSHSTKSWADLEEGLPLEVVT